MKVLTKLLSNELRKLANKLDSGNCELNDEEAMDLLKVIAHESMSKDQACSYLNISRSRFDELVKEGKLPKGRKVRGFKELRFYKDELMVMSESPN